MTDAEFRAWLARDNEIRCVLVELDYIAESDSPAMPAPGTLRFSDRVFFDDVTNYSYVDCVRAAPQYSRSLSGERLGTYNSTVGSLELDNADGELDFLLNLACDGSQIRFYFGGQRWPLSDFKLIFSAITAKVTAPAYDRISVALKDTGLLLNKSIGGTTTVGGVGPNADRARPLNFGYIHNLSPLLIDATIDGGKYTHSDAGVNTEALEVRDRGASVAFVDDTDGTFRLTIPPDGTVTADILAEPVGDENVRVSDALDYLIGDRAGLTALSLYAGAGPTFTVDDDDDYFVGISLPEARNVIDLLADIADSGNLFWAVLRTGEFTFGRLRLNNIADLIADSPPAIEAVDIYEDDIDDKSFRLEHAAPQYYRFQAFMSRNWTRQTDFAELGIPPDDQALYSRNGLYLMQPESIGTAYEDAPELYHKTLEVSPVIDTLLSEAFSEFDLDSLAQWMTTRRAMFLPWIEYPSFVVGIDFYQLELGDVVRLFQPRFGEDDGVLFQVIGTTIRLTDAKIDLRIARRNVIQEVPDRWLRQINPLFDALPVAVNNDSWVTPVLIDPVQRYRDGIIIARASPPPVRAAFDYVFINFAGGEGAANRIYLGNMWYGVHDGTGAGGWTTNPLFIPGYASFLTHEDFTGTLVDSFDVDPIPTFDDFDVSFPFGASVQEIGGFNAASPGPAPWNFLRANATASGEGTGYLILHFTIPIRLFGIYIAQSLSSTHAVVVALYNGDPLGAGVLVDFLEIATVTQPDVFDSFHAYESPP